MYMHVCDVHMAVTGVAKEGKFLSPDLESCLLTSCWLKQVMWLQTTSMGQEMHDACGGEDGAGINIC